MPTASAGLVDVHAHFLTAEYVAAARAAGMERPDGMPGWPEWTLPGQIADMDARGIERALLSISSPGVAFAGERAAELARHVNDEGASHVRAHADRLDLLASLPLPDVDAAVVEARRALGELGARGVILESHAHGQYLGDLALEPLWAELAARNAVVLVHPTTPVGGETTALGQPRPMLEFMFDSTRSITALVLAGVLDRHPGLRVVMPHSGAALPVLSDRVAIMQGMFAGAESRERWERGLRALWFDTAGTPFPRAVPLLAGLVGTERIVYGSDSCWTPAPGVQAQLASIDGAPAPEGAASWRELLARNAAHLLES